MNFRAALASVYRENPCQVLPNALWKTLALVDQCQTAVKMDGDAITHLEMWDTSRLMVFWDRPPTRGYRAAPPFTAFDLLLLHNDYVAQTPTAPGQGYFRLHQTGPTPPPHLPEGFRLYPVAGETEAPEMAALIGQCYPDLHPSPATVKSWFQHPTFAPDLWLWVMDEKTGIPVGLGIAEFDPELREGSLEWVQILPAFQGRGLGKGLVHALLSLLQDRAAFTTVSGQVDAFRPEKLYRQCGFTGDDRWWVISNEH